MSNKFNLNIINDFDDNVINGMNNFVFEYCNTSIKNTWNKICSANDWIHVSINELRNDHSFSNDMKGNINFAHFILTIDIFSGSIEEMWRAFSAASNKKIPYPWNNSKKIFSKKKLYGRNIEKDIDYFEHIRAFFGFHSSNGKEETIFINGNKISFRMFSSWPIQKRHNEFSVMLYSNNDEIEKIYGGELSISVDELIEYASLRYQSLKDLQKKVEEFYKTEIKKSVNKIKKIRLDKSNVLKSIKNLKKCADENYMGMIYNDCIKDYINFLSVNLDVYSKLDKTVVLQYLNKLNEVIPTSFKNHLTDMDYTDNYFELFNINSEFASENSYNISKILSFKENGFGDFNNYKICFNELIKNKILSQYTSKLSYNELLLLIEAKSYESKIDKPNYVPKGINVLKDAFNDIKRNL